MADKKSKSASKPSKMKDDTLMGRYAELHNKKENIMYRSEKYASWTIPAIFPPENMNDTELQGPTNSTGARAVNHLSNKIVMVLFPQGQPFFRLMVAMEVLLEFKAKAKNGDEAAAQILKNLDQQLSDAEKQAVQELEYNRYRTEATNVVKSLIVTGNALLYNPDKGKGKTQSYTLRDYCVVRDLSGTVIELITRNKKALYTFSDDVQNALRASDKKYEREHDCDVTVYTQVKLMADGKYHLKQAVEKVELPDSNGTWTAEELPWLALTWNRLPGEDYGRGLVEDYAGAFHALAVLTSAQLDAVAIAADIKFLVNPGSIVDVKELNDSESGSYHSGNEGDVTAIQLDKHVDLQLVESAIQRYVQEIGQAFLLNSAATRDAERVTAEEIRNTAKELELSNAGIYSRLAEEWQLPTAKLALKRAGVKIGGNSPIIPVIITGIDSLSRAGELDNLETFLYYVGLFEKVPEDVRQRMDFEGALKFIGVRTGIDYTQFVKTETQFKAEQQQAMQQQMAATAAEQAGAAASGIAQSAGEAALQSNQ